MNYRNDIFSFYLSRRVYENRKGYAEAVYGRHVTDRFRSAAKAVLKQLGSLGKRLTPAQKTSLRGKTWVYFNTKNQYDSLQFLHEGTENLCFVSHETGVMEYAGTDTIILPLYASLPFRYLLNYLPTIWRSLRADPEHFARMFHFYALGVGYFEVFTRLVREYRPAMVIMSNDHAVHCRAMMHAANAVDIPTVFFQHATIKEDFPPMRFRYACLEGQDTYDKYREIDKISTTDFRLIGMPKFDRYLAHLNDKDNVEVLGLPYGPADRVEHIRELIYQIGQATEQLTIRLRPHPADLRPLDPTTIPLGSNTLERSDSTTESAFDYLQSVDMIVAGNSSIHLEAVLLNVMAVYYSRNAEHDIYGYLAHGLIDEARTIDALTACIRANQVRKVDNRHRAKYYYAPLGTEWDGRSGELGRQVIQDILSGQPITAPSPKKT